MPAPVSSVHRPTPTMRVLALCCLLVSLAAGQPAKHEFWKGTSMDAVVDQTKLECSQKNDEVACMKFKVLNFIDQVLRKDNFKVLVNFHK